MEVVFEPTSREDAEVRALYAEYIREIDGPLLAAGVVSEGELDEDAGAGPPADLAPPAGLLLVARVAGAPAGLGGLRHLDTGVAEVKSMYVSPAHRGTGLARRILARLERIAAEHDCGAVRLDTSSYLTAAIALYRSVGYVEVPDYNRNPKADLWFERQL